MERRRRTRKANESHIVTNSWSTDTPSDSQKSHIATGSSQDNLSPTEIPPRVSIAESLHAHDASSLTLPFTQVIPPKEHIQETVQDDINTLPGDGSSKLDASSSEKPNTADSLAMRKANVTCR